MHNYRLIYLVMEMSVLVAKFKVGKTYRVTHPDGMWEGNVKVLATHDGETPLVVLTKLIKGSNGVLRYFQECSNGVKLGTLGLDWQPKEVNMTLENK